MFAFIGLDYVLCHPICLLLVVEGVTEIDEKQKCVMDEAECKPETTPKIFVKCHRHRQ